MITGRVIESREAVIPLTLISREGGPLHTNAVLDTGFTDFLTLPRSTIGELNALFVDAAQCQLGDGRIVTLESFEVTVEWDGARRDCLALCAEGEALVGMSLVSGSRVTMDVVPNGELRIEAIA